LCFAVYNEGDRFIEFEKRPAVNSDELLAFDFEFIVSTDPTGPPVFSAASSVLRKILPIFEFLKSDV